MATDRTEYNRVYGIKYRAKNKAKLRTKKVAYQRTMRAKKHSSDEALILGPYKLPLAKVTDGHGFYGALTFAADSRIQCHICGGLFDNLSFHIQNLHKKTVDAYRWKLAESIESCRTDRI